MKKKFFAAVAAMLFVCTAASAQDAVKSFTAGVSPWGIQHVGISYKDDEDYKYDYKSYMNANICFESQTEGFTHLTEITYGQAKFDKFDLEGTSQYFNPIQQEDIMMASIRWYAGRTISPKSRVQLPLYIGIGGEYINGGPIHNLMIDLAAKARLKFYITGKFGIYVGATASVGWGMKSRGEKSSSSSSSESYNIVPYNVNADAGLLFSF